MDHWVLLCKQPHLTTQKQASVNHPFCRESFQQSGCSGYFVSLLLPVYGVSHSLHHHVPLIAVGGLLRRCEDADRYIHIETTLKWSSLRPVSLWPQTIQTDNAVSAKLPAPCMHVLYVYVYGCQACAKVRIWNFNSSHSKNWNFNFIIAPPPQDGELAGSGIKFIAVQR